MVISASSPKLGPTLSARATKVYFDGDLLVVQLEDGRQIGAPVAWFPRLAEATNEQRNEWQLIGKGVGIHWPAIDEDVSVENLLGCS